MVGFHRRQQRAQRRAIRLRGAPHVAISHSPDGDFDLDDLLARARAFPGLEGMDLASAVTRSDGSRPP